MLRITFKSVGQGDCIIIEWKGEKGPRIGIIDCKAVPGYNAAVKHLEDVKPSEVAFVVLSHPHQDHYSGLPAVLEHCQRNGIPIDLFGHTAGNTTAFLRSVVMPHNAREQLVRLYHKVRDLSASGLIKRRGVVNNLAAPIALGAEGLQLRFLSPSETEFEAFIRSQHHSDLTKKSAPDPNLLSTITMLEAEEWHVLLTADATRDALKRVGLSELKREERSLRLGQVPHHGSVENHYREFWRKRRHEEGAPLAISVGLNRYGHPSEKVIRELRDVGYSVQLTGAEAELLTEKGRMVSVALDAVSALSPSAANPATDLTYTFDDRRAATSTSPATSPRA